MRSGARRKRTQKSKAAANITRGAGRDAAALPAGEGGRERGVGGGRRPAFAGHTAPRSKPEICRRLADKSSSDGRTADDTHAIGAPCCRSFAPVIR